MVILSMVTMPRGFVRSVGDDEQIIFIPNTARVLANGNIELHVDAWIYELERRPGLSRILAHYLDLDLDSITDAERELFIQRTQLFRVDSQNSMRLSIKLPDAARHTLLQSAAGGRVSERVVVDAPYLTPQSQWVEFTAIMAPGDTRVFQGRSLLMSERGLSVVSDIDDTIKYSNVLKKKLLLLNTFTRPFLALPQMAQRYQAIAAADPSTSFHYVSSSPLQLYPPLAGFLADSGFPAGTVHLRESTSVRNVIPQHADSRNHKLGTIRRLLADFLERRFLLIGDSGELDPEIYGEIAREFPRRIEGIRIRDVTGDPRQSERYDQAFARLPPNLWELFGDTPAWR